jgi:hypothetical protein
MVKMGSRTLVDAGSVRAFLSTLPAMHPRPDADRKAGGQ